MPTISESSFPSLLLLTAREAAKLLSICQRTLWQLTANGELPVVRIGRSVRYDTADLSQFIARQKRGKPTEEN